jgi:hypothetical protein
MAKHFFGLVALLATAVLAVGCSDDGDGDKEKNGPTVECTFGACGGDLVGTWKATGGCTPMGVEGIPECSSATVDDNRQVTGTVTFNSDGTFSRSSRVVGRLKSSLGEACIDKLTAGFATGEEYCALMALATEFPESGVTGECTYSGGKCSCDLTFDQESTLDGTYTTSGNKVNMETLETEYCVSGKTLKLEMDGVLMTFEREGETGEGGSGGSGEGGTGGSGEGGSGGSGEGGTGGSGEGGTGGSGEGGTGGSGEGGTGGSGETCDFEACGGNPVGTWTVADFCAMTTTNAADDPACQDLPLMVTVSATGGLAYTATTETSTLSFDAWDEVWTMPPACLQVIAAAWEEEDGVPYSVEEVCDTHDYYFATYYGGSCVYASTEGCTCEIDLSPFDWTWETTYEIDGTNIVTPGQSGDIETPYCVDGSTMEQDWGSFIMVLHK